MKTVSRFLLYCVAGLFLLSCSDNQEFAVQGSVENASGKTLYLENIGLSDVVILDSVKLKDDGKFSFKHARPVTPDFYRLRLGDQWINFAVDSTEHITVHADASTGYATTYTIEGSEKSSKIKDLSILQLHTSEAFGHLQKQDADTAYQAKVLEVVKGYKDKAKQYIFEAPASTVAYFALFQQINNMLIFNPYDKDDNRIYSTVATSWDLHYGNSARAKHLHTLTLQGLKVIRSQRVPSFENIETKEALTYFEISLPDINGSTINLSDIIKQGKVIVLDFTAYQAKTSPMHNMDLGSIYEKYQSQGVEILQVSLDSDLHFWQNIASKLPWICVRDAESAYSRVAATYNVQNLPTTYLLNRKGEIEKRIENDKDLDAEIRKML